MIGRAPPARSGRVPAGVSSRILFSVILGVWIDALLLMAGARIAAPLLLVPVLAAGVVTTAGELCLLLFRVRVLVAWLPAAFVAGVSVSSVAMLPATIVLHWPAQTAFLAWSVVVVAAATAGLARRRALPPADWRGALTALPMAVLLAWFCRIEAQAVPTLLRTNILPTWIDYFTHGATIATFASPFAIGVGDIMLPGTPLVFYHYGPFMLPAAIAPMSGLSPLAIATAILPALGLMAGLCGLFALGAELAGVGPALLALWLLTVLPDASQQGLRNGFYGFHWLMLIGPGSGYAIGTAALAYLCALPWFRERRTGPLALAGLLTLMLVQIRVHMVMLMAPALAGAVALTALPARWSRAALAAGLGGAGLLTVLLLAGRLGPELPALLRTADYVRLVAANGPPAYAGALLPEWPFGLGVLAGVALTLVAALGFWALALPIVAVLARRAGRFTAADQVPLLLCLVSLLLVVWAPVAGNNDMTEYKHRHFVLLYALVVVWTTLRALDLVGAASWLAGWTPRRAIAVVGGVTLATMLALHAVDPSKPPKAMPWAPSFYAQPVAPGIPQLAAFLRAHARDGDRLAVGGSGAQPSLTGPALQVVSLTGVPSYVGRIDFAVGTRPPAIAALVRQRAAEVDAIGHATDRDAAMVLLRAASIRWLVAVAPELPAWDPKGTAAAYQNATAYLYDAAPEDASPNGANPRQEP
ncbi:MAG: hypothetical protein NVSMB18_33530 [Acetobacteraceae bacterium]